MSDGPRVLLCGRPDLRQRPGGDTRQILSLLRHLGSRGRLSLDLEPAVDGCDVVHLFNLSRPVEPALQARAAARAGRPVVLTTIFQDLDEYNRRGRFGAGRTLHRALGGSDRRLADARALLHLMRSGAAAARQLELAARLALSLVADRGAATALQRELLGCARMVVLCSALEGERVRSALRVDLARPVEVPVGIDPAEVAAHADDGAAFGAVSGLAPASYVLCVGRLEALKNQLALIEALRDEPELELVLVGQPNPLDRAYVAALRRAAAGRGKTRIFDRGLPRPLLLSAMSGAAAHVLPSWFETAGLATMEAAAAGCPVVSTDRGYARAVLGDDAAYCDPADAASIGAAIRLARRRGPSAVLRRRVLERFTEAAAEQAMDRVYLEAVQ